jgi:hypothetical protein
VALRPGDSRSVPRPGAQTARTAKHIRFYQNAPRHDGPPAALHRVGRKKDEKKRRQAQFARTLSIVCMWRGPNASRTSSPSSAPIRAEGNRLVESRNDPRGAFPGIDQPSQPERGVECFRRDSENPPFPSEELEMTLVVLALTENVPKVPRRLETIAGVRPSKKRTTKNKG